MGPQTEIKGINDLGFRLESITRGLKAINYTVIHRVDRNAVHVDSGPYAVHIYLAYDNGSHMSVKDLL